MLLVKSVLALISALALASGQQFAEWMTHDFDDLDVCLYNGNLRTKKIRETAVTMSAENYLKGTRGLNLFVPAASTVVPVLDPTLCVPTTCTASGTKRFAFLYRDISGANRGTLLCATGDANTNTVTLTIDGVSRSIDISCSECYSNGFSDNVGFPESRADGFIVVNWIIDNCSGAGTVSSRCSACDDTCGGGCTSSKSSKTGKSSQKYKGSQKYKSGQKKGNASKKGKKSKAPSASKKGKKSKAPSTNGSSKAPKASKISKISKFSSSKGSCYYPPEICCIATNSCANTAPPTQFTVTSSPTKTPSAAPSPSPTDNTITASPLPCPVTCKDIPGSELEQAIYYLENNPNPTVEDYQAANCPVPFDLSPCCLPWCQEDGTVRPRCDFPDGCPQPPYGFECGPSSAPSPAPTDNSITASPLPCPVTCKDVPGTELEQAIYYLENNPNPTAEDYEAANCQVPFDLSPCCLPWCEEDGTVRPRCDFPDGCPPPPFGLECAPSPAPSPSPTGNTVTEPPTKTPSASPLPCPVTCKDVPGTEFEQALYYYRNNPNPTKEDYDQANCPCPPDLSPCCFSWCTEEGTVRPPEYFPYGCTPPPYGLECAPSPAPSPAPTDNTVTEPPTKTPSASPLPCPVTCKDIPGGEFEQALYYYRNNPNPTVEDYQAANCQVPFDLSPCCFSWCAEDGTTRPSSYFPYGCTPPPYGYDCSPNAPPSASPSAKPSPKPTVNTQTEPPHASMRYLEEMFEE